MFALEGSTFNRSLQSSILGLGHLSISVYTQFNLYLSTEDNIFCILISF